MRKYFIERIFEKKNKVQLNFNNEKLFAVFSDYLEEGYKRFKRIIEISHSQTGEFIDNLEEKIAGDRYVNELHIDLNIGADISINDEKTEVLNKIKTSMIKAKNMFKDEMINKEKLVIEKSENNRYLKIKEVKYSEEKYFNYSFRFANKIIKELSLREAQIEINLQDINEIDIDVEIYMKIFGNQFDRSWIRKTKNLRYIANWKGNKDVLVVLYTGSMSNYSREGLVEFFNQVDYEKKVLLSTSAVEVGVDFDCDMLITEETNIASFLQRFGRAGRSGKDSSVKLFVTNDSYNKLAHELYEKEKITREDFSELITAIFEEIRGIEDKEFLEAYHYNVNRNIGRIGQILNQDYDTNTKKLGVKLRKEVDLNYGLRGTMPTVSLRGGVSKNPFYILRFLENADLIDSDSPFEIAYTEKSFDSLIWKSYGDSEDVYVDINSTLKHSKLMFIEEKRQIKTYIREGICDRYENEFLRRYDNFKKLENKIFSSEKYNELEDYDQGMLKYLLSNKNKFILGFGNIFLHKDSGAVMLEDRRLNIPNQFFLFLIGDKVKQDKYMKWLRENKIFDYGEIIVDDTNYKNQLNEEHHYRNPGGVVFLENINGALFYLYKKLIRAQKEGELL